MEISVEKYHWLKVKFGDVAFSTRKGYISLKKDEVIGVYFEDDLYYSSAFIYYDNELRQLSKDITLSYFLNHFALENITKSYIREYKINKLLNGC